jgi:hypothetical protein
MSSHITIITAANVPTCSIVSKRSMSPDTPNAF